jgi:hypothetical protein
VTDRPLTVRLEPDQLRELAVLVADELRREPAVATDRPASAVTLDAFLPMLPPIKPEQAWRKWLYERLRHGDVPGTKKIGNRWSIHHEVTLAWVEAGCPSERGDATVRESLVPRREGAHHQ